ncbi:MAG: hypothetical protein ABIN58_11130 [candidate division WOR-3 bacterium]
MATPSTENYTIGKGVLYFDRHVNGVPSGMRDLGNAPNFTLTVTPEILDHFSSREGLKKKDKSVVVSLALGGKFTLEEYDIDNLALALYGSVSGRTMTLLAEQKVEGHLRFIGDPAQGPQYKVELWKVTLKPAGELGFISDEWGKIDFEFTVEDDSDNHPTSPYGTIEQFWDS